jgi:hypothetical protein
LTAFRQRCGHSKTVSRAVGAPRRINCTGDRTPAKEVFALRNI